MVRFPIEAHRPLEMTVTFGDQLWDSPTVLNMSIRFRKTAREWYEKDFSNPECATACIDVTDQQVHFAFDVHFLPWLYSVLIDFFC